MPTTITKTVGSSGRQYATLALAIAAIPADLRAGTGTDEEWVLELYNDSEFSAGGTLTGITTDATHRVIIRAASGQSFKDHASKLTNALNYDQSKGVGIATLGVSSDCITIGINDCVISGLQLKADQYGIRQTSSGSGVRIENCIVTSNNTTSGSGGAYFMNGGIVVNCLGVMSSGGSCCVDGGSSEFHNVTAIQAGASTNYGFRGNYTSPLYKNCASFGFPAGQAFRTGSHASSNYNASDDTSAPGANSVHSLSASSQFVNTASDWKVKAGAGLINAGTRDQTYTSDLDILGQDRSTSTPTIGAHEYVSGGGSPSVKRAMLMGIG